MRNIREDSISADLHMESEIATSICFLPTMSRKLLLVIALMVPALIAHAHDKRVWQDKKCAVSLTHDDALNVHLDTVVPLLDSLGFKGTFYLSGFFPSFRNRSTEWRAVAENGHELGTTRCLILAKENRLGESG
jgi:peptidoglycan/xylan/chitin deacetylase (PgdA/CDA1 family)